MTAISMLLMIKQRRLERIDAEILKRFEERSGLEQLLGVAPHAHPNVRARAMELLSWSTHKFIFYAWMAGLAGFIAVAIYALIAI